MTSVLEAHSDDATLQELRAFIGALSEEEQTDLVVFLETLSTFSNPWRPEDFGKCD